jgi:hypothetical protein
VRQIEGFPRSAEDRVHDPDRSSAVGVKALLTGGRRGSCQRRSGGASYGTRAPSYGEWAMTGEQNLDELAAHYGPRGPVAAANEWMTLVLSGNLRAVWPRTDATLRLALAQAWLWANREHPDVASYDLDDVARSLAGLTFDHDLWAAFEETQTREFRDAWPDFNHDDWGAASRPRPVPPDCEIVFYMRTGGEALTVTQETLVENPIILLMRSTPDGWLVRGFSDQQPKPGWPPKLRLRT